jgi:hypothetical protein
MRRHEAAQMKKRTKWLAKLAGLAVWHEAATQRRKSQ